MSRTEIVHEWRMNRKEPREDKLAKSSPEAYVATK